MQIYRAVEGVHDALVGYRRTRKEAHELVNERLYPEEHTVQLLEIPTDAASIVAYLNGGTGSDVVVIHDMEGVQVLKEWDVTPRGGLKEAE